MARGGYRHVGWCSSSPTVCFQRRYDTTIAAVSHGLESLFPAAHFSAVDREGKHPPPAVATIVYSNPSLNRAEITQPFSVRTSRGSFIYNLQGMVPVDVSRRSCAKSRVVGGLVYSVGPAEKHHLQEAWPGRASVCYLGGKGLDIFEETVWALQV